MWIMIVKIKIKISVRGVFINVGTSACNSIGFNSNSPKSTTDTFVMFQKCHAKGLMEQSQVICSTQDTS